jgi:transposase
MPKGTPPLSVDAKKIIHSVHEKTMQEALETRNSVLIEASGYRRTARLCGVSRETVKAVEAEFLATGILTPTKRKRISMRFRRIDAFTRSAVRNVIHNFFERNVPPTLDMVHTELRKGDANNFPYSRSTLYGLLKQMGFAYRRRNKRYYICERPDIIAWRKIYLSKLEEYRQSEKYQFVFLDETWFNANDTFTKCWHDVQSECSQQITGHK